MDALGTAFGNELAKILWRAKYRVMIVIYAAAGLCSGLFGASGFGVRLLREFIYNVTGSNVVYGALSLYRSLLLPLAIFMLAADSFAHELETKSIKCVLTRPIGRFEAYLAKCLAILCYVAFALGTGFAAVQAWQVVSAAVAGGAAAPLSAGAPAVAEAFAAYALTLVPMAAFVAFATFISVVFRSPALVMFVCIALYCAFSVIGILYNGAGAALFTAYTGWYRMWLGERLPWRSLAASAGLLLSTCVAFFGFGFFIFEKKDI